MLLGQALRCAYVRSYVFQLRGERLSELVLMTLCVAGMGISLPSNIVVYKCNTGVMAPLSRISLVSTDGRLCAKPLKKKKQQQKEKEEEDDVDDGSIGKLVEKTNIENESNIFMRQWMNLSPENRDDIRTTTFSFLFALFVCVFLWVIE